MSKFIYIFFNFVLFLMLYLIINVDTSILSESFLMGLLTHFFINCLIFFGVFLALSFILGFLKGKLVQQRRVHVTDIYYYSSSLLGFIFSFLIVMGSYKVTSYGDWYLGIKSSRSLVERMVKLQSNRSLKEVTIAMDLANSNGTLDVIILSRKSFDDFQKLRKFDKELKN